MSHDGHFSFYIICQLIHVVCYFIKNIMVETQFLVLVCVMYFNSETDFVFLLKSETATSSLITPFTKNNCFFRWTA